MGTMIELKGVKVVNKHNKLVMKNHQRAIQAGVGVAMTLTRLRAAENIIANKTGTMNPYQARKMQKSTDGRLTSRTGKLKLMLSFGASASNPLKSWDASTLGKKIYKETKNIGLKGQVRLMSTNNYRQEYLATYRVFIKEHGWLFSRFQGMPLESKKTLAMRFNWETGIRGRKRPIFANIVDLTMFNMVKEVKRKDGQIWR